jgi:5'-3' exonuclease
LISLIDGDIVSFSCAIYNETFGWGACREDMDQLMKRILETTGATDYRVFITGSNNFRYQVDSEYKANRRGKVDPIYRADANAYLVESFGGVVTDGFEADDAMGVAATEFRTLGVDCTICSIDKDLKQIAGKHYNWRKNEFDNVTALDGLRLFYRQCLTGDTADNVRGVGGIGPVKSARIINDLTDEVDMFQAVSAMYTDQERFLKNGQLLHIWQKENDDWAIQYTALREQVAKL